MAVKICPCRKKNRVEKYTKTKGKGAKAGINSAFQTDFYNPISAINETFTALSLETDKTALAFSPYLAGSLASRCGG